MTVIKAIDRDSTVQFNSTFDLAQDTLRCHDHNKSLTEIAKSEIASARAGIKRFSRSHCRFVASCEDARVIIVHQRVGQSSIYACWNVANLVHVFLSLSRHFGTIRGHKTSRRMVGDAFTMDLHAGRRFSIRRTTFGRTSKYDITALCANTGIRVVFTRNFKARKFRLQVL